MGPVRRVVSLLTAAALGLAGGAIDARAAAPVALTEDRPGPRSAGGRLPATFALHAGQIETSGLERGNADTALGFGAMISPEAFPPYLALSFELWGWAWEQPNTAVGGGFLVTADDEVDIAVNTISVGVAALYPLGSDFRAYGQFGLGYSEVTYEVRGEAFLLPATIEDDEDSEISFVLGLGLAWSGERVDLGVHARRFDIDSGSSKLGVAEFDAGGDYLGLGLAWRF